MKKMEPLRPRSFVWRYFQILQEDSCKVRCSMCFAIISRGGVGKSAGTSCMRNHLRWKHSDVFSVVFSKESPNVGRCKKVVGVCGNKEVGAEEQTLADRGVEGS